MCYEVAKLLLTGAMISETMINDTITIRPMVPLSSGMLVGSLRLPFEPASDVAANYVTNAY